MNNRRDFLVKQLLLACGAVQGDTRRIRSAKAPRKQRFNMSGYARAPKIEKAPHRHSSGWATAGRAPANDAADRGRRDRAVRLAIQMCLCGQQTSGRHHPSPTLYAGNKDEWMKLCEQGDLIW